MDINLILALLLNIGLTSAANLKICQFSGYCAVSSDCIPGNLCEKFLGTENLSK